MKEETYFGKITVYQVTNESQLRRFIQFPKTIYREDPNWTPPLERDLKSFLSPQENPFFDHAETAYFLAECDGKIVGRVAAIVNRSHNNFHHDQTGFFGMFESLNDEDTANALIEVAGEWLLFRGLKTMRGPMNFSMNDDFGCVLSEKEKRLVPARPLQPYNPGFYQDLFMRSDLEPVKDCVAMVWEKDRSREVLELQPTLQGMRIRPVRSQRLSTLFADLKAINGVYQAAWSRNWGFLPSSDQELEFTAKRLRSILDPNLMLLAETEGEVVGMILALPDYHVMLRHLRGHIYPWLLPRAIQAQKKNTTAVLIAFGIRPSFQGTGLANLLLHDLKVRNPRYDSWETNWILEDNERVQHLLATRYGAQIAKRFRIFERALD